MAGPPISRASITSNRKNDTTTCPSPDKGFTPRLGLGTCTRHGPTRPGEKGGDLFEVVLLLYDEVPALGADQCCHTSAGTC